MINKNFMQEITEEIIMAVKVIKEDEVRKFVSDTLTQHTLNIAEQQIERLKNKIKFIDLDLSSSGKNKKVGYNKAIEQQLTYWKEQRKQLTR